MEKNIMYTTIQTFGVSKIFFFKKLMLIFSKDALNCL